MIVETQNNGKTWFLNPAEQTLYNLNVIDFSRQFELAVKNNGEVEKHFSLRYDLSCFKHNVSHKNSYLGNEFFFYDSELPFDDFCTRFCDVKIHYLELQKSVSFDFVVANFKDYYNTLFK
jgi:hypothetical protein